MKVFKGDFDQYIPADGVISVSTMESIGDAERIVDDFENYARTKRADLDQSIVAEKQRGFNEGFAEGVSELSQSMAAYQSSKAAIVDHAVPLARQCLEYVFSRLDKADVLSALIVEATDRMKSAEPFIIRLHPNHHETVRTSLNKIIERMGEIPPHLSSWEIIVDAAMNEHSCELIFRDQIVLVSQTVAIDAFMKFIDLYYSEPMEASV